MPVAETWTIKRVLEWTAQRFADRGMPSARLDAEVLLARALGTDRIGLYLHHDKPLEEEELTRARDLVRRRLSGEPVAYITGSREFWSLPLAVDRRVLVPRPETEHLVEEALRLLDAVPAGPVADVGTGSGAVAFAIKKERPDRTVVGVDLSEEALAVARSNRDALGLDVELCAGDLLQSVRDRAPFALVVANLPYVPEEEAGRLEVARFEPPGALFASGGGLAILARLIHEAPPLLAAGGALALEIGAGQAAAVRAKMVDAGFTNVQVVRDLARMERIVSGRRG